MNSKVKKNILSEKRLLSCSSTTRSNKLKDKKMLYLNYMKQKTKIMKASDKMKTFNVTFNKNEVVYNDNYNRQAMFKDNSFLDRDYVYTTNKNAFSITMIAKNHLDCLEKAKQFFKDTYNKLANSIEVRTVQKATNTSIVVNNNQLKLVA